jgi:hypothetical protein
MIHTDCVKVNEMDQIPLHKKHIIHTDFVNSIKCTKIICTKAHYTYKFC